MVVSSLDEKLKFKDVVNLVANKLGVPLEMAAKKLRAILGMFMQLEWLRGLFCSVNDSHDLALIECTIKGYLLFLLGCTLFTDKSTTWVPIMYLKLLTKLWELHEYAWGATTLAHLYRQLGMTNRVDVKQMVGYITLLDD